MRRIIKKILKYVIRTVLILVLLLVSALVIFYIYINSSAGREKLAYEVSRYLKKTLGNEISISSAKWNFPASVELSHMVLKDHKNKDMLVIEKLNAGLAFYNFVSGRITFSDVSLHDVNFDLVRYPGDSSSNFGYIINRLTASGGDTTKRAHTDIMFNVVNIENMHFTWDDQTLKHISYPGIDWDHLDVKNFNAKFTYLWIDGNDVSAKIKKLNLAEGSGFVIKDLEGIAKYTNTSIDVKSLYLLTPNSEIRKHVRLDYDDPGSLSNFVDNASITAELSDSKVSFKDLAFFTPDLKNKTDVVLLSNLESRGKVSDLHISDIDASYGSYSVIRGKVEMKGLPNIDETFISAKFKQTVSSKAEMEKLMPELALPDIMDKFGTIKMKGNFTGFISDFVAYADFETALGNASTDLNMKIVKDAALCTYSGKLALDGFDIGRLTDEPLFGPVSMNAEVKGRGLTLESVNADLLANIRTMAFKKYNYSDIKVNGTVASKFFKGEVGIHDKNLALNFKGTIDYTKEKPLFNFLADVTNANLFELNLAQDSLSLATTVKIDLKGIKPDDIDGAIVARGTRLFVPGKAYFFDSINVNSAISPHHREINIHSDLLSGNINGDFQLSRIGDLLKSAANRYIDSGFLKIKAEPLRDQYVNFDLKFHDMAPLFSVLRTKVIMADSGYLKGNIYANESKVNFEGSLPSISYKDLHFNNLKISGTGNQENLNLRADLGTFVNGDTLLVRDAVIKLRSNTDKLFFDIYGADILRQKQAWVKGSFDVEGPMAWLDLDSSKIMLQKDPWNITAQRITFYKDTLIDMPLLKLNKGAQTIRLAGKYSKTNSYPIRITLEDLGLPNLALFIPQMEGVGGELNGQVLINNINDKPIVESAVYISTLAYEKDTIGTLSASTSYNVINKKLSVDAKLESKEQVEVGVVKGDITIDEKQELVLKVNLNQTEIKIFEPLISDIFSDFKGQATADISIGGTLNEPVVKGAIALTDAEFRVNYTNVKYHFTHTFSFGGRMINIKNLDVYDAYNNQATVNGKFDLSRLDRVKMNLEINAKKLMALNTTQKISDLYFGKAFGTGLVSINGPLRNLKFIIKMKTEKNTTFSMPISQGNTFYGHDFIKFIGKDNYLKKGHDINNGGISLSMDLEITPDAFAQIIFDPRVGDIIEAHGNGNLRLDINTDGDFNMFGAYTITDGNYRFTAFDIINKAFLINPGSTITWNGNPYEAQLNVQAIYTLRTTLAPLQATTEKDTKVYPVDAILYLKGSLYQPEIKLDFEIRELYSGNSFTSDIETRVRQIKSNEQDLNQQVVSLLVLNQFAPTEPGIGSIDKTGAAVANSSLGDLVSNQLNYLASKYFENLHVGIDYRQNEEATFRVSQDILKQRGTISGSYDAVNNNYNTQLLLKLKQDGSLQGRVFGRSNNNPLLQENSNTQGVGILYRREFDKIDELFRKRAQKPKPQVE